MTTKTKTAMQQAAQGIADLPPIFEELYLKDSFLDQSAWDDFNGALCRALDDNVTPDELDDFWKANNSRYHH